MFKKSEFPGKFITFEGIEGSGKTTNINFFAEYLRSNGIDIVLTREPGGTPMGEKIRSALLANYAEEVYPITEILLLFAARSQHIENIIKPALRDGSCVLSDRFTDATYAYQGGGRGIPFQDIMLLENMVQKEFRPDFTIIFDIPVEISLKRIQKRKNIDRIEQEKIGFFNKVRQVYLDRAKNVSGKYKIIDATKPLQEVQNILQNMFPL